MYSTLFTHTHTHRYYTYSCKCMHSHIRTWKKKLFKSEFFFSILWQRLSSPRWSKRHITNKTSPRQPIVGAGRRKPHSPATLRFSIRNQDILVYVCMYVCMYVCIERAQGWVSLKFLRIQEYFGGLQRRNGRNSQNPVVLTHNVTEGLRSIRGEIPKFSRETPGRLVCTASQTCQRVYSYCGLLSCIFTCVCRGVSHCLGVCVFVVFRLDRQSITWKK